MVCTVWLFTRPLSFLPPFSDGKPALRHWGVLVSELTFGDIEVIIQRARAYSEDDTPLGTMYELFREEEYNNVNIVRPFGTAIVHKEWRAFSAKYVGTTEWTFQLIDLEGTTYLLFLFKRRINM
jgi:hypothetical protein